MTFSPEKDAWDAGNGTWFKAEDAVGWRVVRYTGDPADPLTIKYTGREIYADKEQANKAAEREARAWREASVK